MKGYPAVPGSLGEHLRKRRLDLRQTQEKVAGRFGVTYTSYNGWEADRIAPKISQWPEVIRFLGYDPLPHPKSFAEAVTALRRSLGMDKRKLAARLGVDVKSVTNWEAGKTRPLSNMRKRIISQIGRSELSQLHHLIC